MWRDSALDNEDVVDWSIALAVRSIGLDAAGLRPLLSDANEPWASLLTSLKSRALVAPAVEVGVVLELDPDAGAAIELDDVNAVRFND